jgi:signal transduction histidine kinase
MRPGEVTTPTLDTGPGDGMLRSVATFGARPPFRTRFAQLGVDTGYAMASFPIALASFIALITLFSVGAGMLITLVGLPILVATMYVARGFATVERAQLSWVAGRPLPPPRYKATRDRTGMRRLLVPLADGQYWLDLLNGVLSLITAIVTWSFAVTWWAGALGGLSAFAWDWSIPYGPDNRDVPYYLGLGNGALPRVLFSELAGLVFALSLIPVMRWVTRIRLVMARALLVPSEAAWLRERVDALQASRAAAAAAETSALRKLERDIHDGPQQRLVRLGMDLDLAKRRMASDPDAAGALLEQAVAQTKETLHELRAVSRGIAPPILVDRGLAAALSALAGRCTVPVQLLVGLDERTRLPGTVEQTAYFVIAEALTNIAKHSGAQQAEVTVSLVELDGEPARLRITVQDDGVGGAHQAKGHGLSGLGDRVAAVDGTLHLSSPAGGPTALLAELPCAQPAG